MSQVQDKNEAVIMSIDAVRTRNTTQEALVTLAVPLEHADLISGLMSKIGKQVGVAMVEIGQAAKQYGTYAKALKLSGFCSNPELHKKLGTDKDYLAWLKTQNCIFRRKDVGPCEGDIVAAHVRRVSRGSGTAHKPEWSAVSCCNKHHQLQHSAGEGALMDLQQYEAKANEQLEQWAWDTIKSELSVNSMAEVSPKMMIDFVWMIAIDPMELPAIYRRRQ